MDPEALDGICQDLMRIVLVVFHVRSPAIGLSRASQCVLVEYELPFAGVHWSGGAPKESRSVQLIVLARGGLVDQHAHVGRFGEDCLVRKGHPVEKV